MDIGVLGDVQIMDGELGWGPTAPKQQQLLATLALAVGHVVTMSSLIDELWFGVVPPRSAVTAVQTYVMNLRALMTSRSSHGRLDPKDVLITSRGGYRLDLGTGTVDADLFEQAVDEGCQSLSEGDNTEAAQAFQRGLALWRGSAPLDGVPLGPRLSLEVSRLEELRLTALEGRIEADIRIGRHRQVLGELRYLTENHPLHEGFHAQLMLVLHRTGRRGQALEAFARLRAALRQELGIDPMPELRDLQREILHGASEKRWAAQGAGWGGMAVIGQVG
ncbi:AfsR/SARP family transcriptional regulator [Streptomyces sp. NPDC001415]